jgi:A/G-specific adenine glycosylase
MDLSQQQRDEFSETLWSFYSRAGRDLPWRIPSLDGEFKPYEIMVSELMLQQTQVSRVMPKYHEFLARFPTVQVLADADLGEVLRMWQGLGYNRRAKFLWQAAQQVAVLGKFPDTLVELVKLPGIGINTAGAILAYAYNQPSLFIETNVRTVYIHQFFPDEHEVTDKQLLSLLEQTIDQEHPREFYWALMDYGSHLKATIGNPNRVSKHYTKQSKFDGSRRQLRGQVIRTLGADSYEIAELRSAIADERLDAVLEDLIVEGMVHVQDGMYTL